MVRQDIGIQLALVSYFYSIFIAAILLPCCLNQQYVRHFKMHLDIDLLLCMLLFTLEACCVNAERNNYEQLSQTQQRYQQSTCDDNIIIYLYLYLLHFCCCCCCCFQFVEANHVSQLCWNVHAILLVCHYTLISQIIIQLLVLLFIF